MTWVAVAVAGGAIAGGVITSQGAKSAADTQAGAANRAADLTQQQYLNNVKLEQPYMTAGQGALSNLDNLLGIGKKTGSGYGSLLQPFTLDTFKKMSPAYKFQLQQGQQGVLNGEASGQGALSGAALKDLTSYNQQFANTAWDNAFNQYQTQQGNIYTRLANIANLGQNAASGTGQNGANLAGSTAQSITNAGSAQAAGQVGAANAWSNSLGQLSSLPWLLKGSNGGGGGGGGGGGLPSASVQASMNDQLAAGW